jgi:hypothetical protein
MDLSFAVVRSSVLVEGSHCKQFESSFSLATFVLQKSSTGRKPVLPTAVKLYEYRICTSLT